MRNKREALIHYIQEEYFGALTRARHHVICTIPVYDTEGHGNHSQSLTDVKIQIYSPPSQDGDSEKSRDRSSKNAIVVLGMNDGRKMPKHNLPPNYSFGTGAYGTLCLSRDAFLETQFLAALADINKQTTILPAFAGIDHHHWDLQLTTWEKHHIKKGLECKWRPVVSAKEHPGDLKFEWMNRDDWRYVHEGELGYNGTFLVKCKPLCSIFYYRDTYPSW